MKITYLKPEKKILRFSDLTVGEAFTSQSFQGGVAFKKDRFTVRAFDKEREWNGVWITEADEVRFIRVVDTDIVTRCEVEMIVKEIG